MKLRGTITKVRFYNPARHYAVLSVRTEDGSVHACVGTLPTPVEGMWLIADAAAVQDPRYGDQFVLSNAIVHRPPLRTDLVGYLTSGLFKGVGKVLANRLVETFGEDVFAVMERSPEKLTQVRGVTASKAQALHTAFAAARPVHQVMLHLRKLGLGAKLARRAYETLRKQHSDVAAAIRYNPYILAQVPGIGFVKADEAARRQGLAQDAPPRILAGMLHVIQERARSGHTQVGVHPLIDDAAKLLGVPPRACAEYVDEHVASGTVMLDRLANGQAVVALSELSAAERAVAQGLAKLSTGRPVVEGAVAIDALVARAGMDIEPSQRQREAVEQALCHPVSILTGGPGMGKTTITKLYLQQVQDAGLTSLLLAPTGRAAVQLGQATDSVAQTIHRALGLVGGHGHYRDLRRPIEADVVVCDEASMVGAGLAARLIAALQAGTRLLLVGDADQLPSVEPGNVLGDLIASGVLPTARLSQVFRQGEGSGIARAARDVLHGIMPSLAKDFTFVELNKDQDVADFIVQEAMTRFRSTGRLDSLQILTPLRQRGVLASASLNRAIQSQIYGRRIQQGLEVGDQRVLHPGDKVLQTRNNYDLDIYNGDIGEVVSVDVKNRSAAVNFRGICLTIAGQGLYDLELAYGITVHKSQGGQFPTVIMPVHSSHAFMLHRNLLYTGITRAQQELILVGDRRGLERAITNRQQLQRETALARHIRDAFGVRPRPKFCTVQTLSPFRR